MTKSLERHSGPRIWAPPLLVAAVAGVLVLHVCPSTAPGITLDEPFNAQEGIRLATVYPDFVMGRLTLLEAFGDHVDWQKKHRPPVGVEVGGNPPMGIHLADHPPLGRLWLGVSYEVSSRSGLFGGGDVWGELSAARTGSAVAFAITVFLVGLFAGRCWGAAAGAFAAISLATMPRVFGHAHLASLETVMNLTFTASVLSVAAFWTDKPPRPRTAAWTGVFFGLALLTKIQAVLIPIPVILWALFRYRQRALLPLAIWGLVGFAVFFAGWPWLWIDPANHPLEYFRRSSERVVLHAFYLGERYRDRDVPWHFPAVMFAVTTPICWLILGGLGVLRGFRGEAKSRWTIGLLAGTAAFPLVLFAVPGVVIYDGVRLFLVVFPLSAVLVGRGAAVVSEWLAKRFSKTVRVGICAVVIALPVGSMALLQPCYLSYYNGLTAGLWGAEKLGFEPTYWGDSLTPELLDEVAKLPEGTVVDVVPVMHSFQVPVLQQEITPGLEKQRITLRAYDPPNNGPSEYVLFFRRRADLSPELQPLPEDAEIVAEVRRQGVLLAALVRFRR